MATKRHKIFNDSVHGHMEIHPLLVEIIDTPQFQRLRNIKQLGGGYFVFPGASHNRFEHSLGVAHLAGKLVQSLRAQEPDITNEDELCVQIAGLCHDLGHGPFSHVFEVFMKEAGLKWEHEEQSVKMFEQLIKEKSKKSKKTIKEIMKDEYGLGDTDIEFIKELICTKKVPENEWPYTGRTEKKAYLYEIVANKLTGIDVDKMDYFSRDCLHLGMKSNFSHERYVMFARVCTNEKHVKQICMRDKEALNMYELFHVRYLLHRNVYQHRVTKAVEMMIIDALLAAEEQGFELESKKISEIALSHPDLYLRLTDDILQQIKTSSSSPNPNPNPNPNPKAIIERLVKRDLYTFLRSKIFKPTELKDLNTHEQKMELVSAWLKRIEREDLLQIKSIFKVKCVRIDYGMKNENPINFLQFYSKDNENKAKKLPANEISYIQPEIFEESNVMLFCTERIDNPLSETQITEFWEIIQKYPED